MPERARPTKKRNKKMYGQITSSKSSRSHLKLGEVGSFAILSIALCSVSAVLYVLATAFVGGGAA
jgi:hypothetical protein